MEQEPAYHSDSEEFKVLRRGNRAVSEGRLQFVSDFIGNFKSFDNIV